MQAIDCVLLFLVFSSQKHTQQMLCKMLSEFQRHNYCCCDNEIPNLVLVQRHVDRVLKSIELINIKYL